MIFISSKKTRLKSEINRLEQELSEEINDDSPSIPEELIEISDEDTV